jgi:hypothetical protein
MRRLLIAAVLALAALVSTAAPVSANHDNWAWSYNVDAQETTVTVDAYTNLVWDVGWSSMNVGCGNIPITFQNRRPGGHSVRLQYVSRASGFVAWDIVVNGVGPGETVFITVPASNIAISSEPYVRWKWGDNAYGGWHEIDYFFNHPADTMHIHTAGYYC